MKVLTEAIVRAQLKATEPEVYYIPEGKLLSPAAREYLNQQKIQIDYERNREKRERKEAQALAEKQEAILKKESEKPVSQARYIDYETGAGYMEKPEHMTALYDNFLVDKNHPRIKFRGKLDRLQADVVLAQTMIARDEENKKILDDLSNILGLLREIMRCEVLDEPFTEESIIGMSHQELREKSHAPTKYFGVEYMKLPDYTMGQTYSLLNMLRTSTRETEVMAVEAFKEKRRFERSDIVEELNRISSAFHIMMCMYLSGQYSK